MSGRNVRVTVEGATLQMDDTGVVRVRVGAGHPGAEAFPLMVIDAGWPGVTVETVEPVRTWTEGDVVLSELASYRRDGDGMWYGLLPSGASVTLEDGDVDTSLRSDSTRVLVLRYQAGEL